MNGGIIGIIGFMRVHCVVFGSTGSLVTMDYIGSIALTNLNQSPFFSFGKGDGLTCY